MKLAAKIRFFTLVQLVLALTLWPILSRALPTQEIENVEPTQNTTSEAESTNAPDQLWQKEQSMGVSEPPKAAKGRLSQDHDYYFPFRTSISPQLGAGYDSVAYGENQSIIYLFGIQYQWTSEERKAFEINMNLQSNAEGTLSFGRKHFLSRARTRPFYKYGVGCWLIGSEQLATVIKYQNYHLRGSFGSEFMVAPPMSARLELELVAGIRSIQLLVLGGYSWAW